VSGTARLEGRWRDRILYSVRSSRLTGCSRASGEGESTPRSPLGGNVTNLTLSDTEKLQDLGFGKRRARGEEQPVCLRSLQHPRPAQPFGRLGQAEPDLLQALVTVVRRYDPRIDASE